jgi:muramidase (phage lysozyme)
MDKMTPIATKGLNKNVEKFLMLITFTEGTDRQKTPYNELFGFTNFVGYEKHPNILIKSSNYSSTAAGRYQILKGTAKMLKMKDFTPESQDLAAIQLIKGAKAYQLVIDGEFEAAILKCNKIWASLPGSPYGQPTHKMIDAINFLNSI